MVPEKYKNYMYNDNDFFNEGFYVTDPEKDELVRKLAALITDDISLRGLKDITPDLPDYWILDRLLTKEQVKFMLSFKKKRVAKLTAEQLAERNGMSKEDAEAMAFGICEIGLLEFDRENEARERQYFIP
ncbi:MAG: hypothetical protein IKP86_05080 [Anaerolineaceae bacterium]|nr:hypothetical protein [Anaerolineaceae bacterium]